VVKIRIAVFCVMTPCCSLYQGLGEVHSYAFTLEVSEVTEETHMCIPAISTTYHTTGLLCHDPFDHKMKMQSNMIL